MILWFYILKIEKKSLFIVRFCYILFLSKKKETLESLLKNSFLRFGDLWITMIVSHDYNNSRKNTSWWSKNLLFVIYIILSQCGKVNVLSRAYKKYGYFFALNRGRISNSALTKGWSWQKTDTKKFCYGCGWHPL